MIESQIEMIPKDRLTAVKNAIRVTLGDFVLQEATQLACGSLSIIIKLVGNDNKIYILRVMALTDDLLKVLSQKLSKSNNAYVPGELRSLAH